MEEDKQPKPKKPVGLYITIPILAVVSIITILSFIDPQILIGFYLDDDIRNQLTKLQEAKLSITNRTEVSDYIVQARFTFENDGIVDMRVSRSVDVFNELFKDHERDHSINKNENTTTLDLRWAVDKNTEK